MQTELNNDFFKVLEKATVNNLINAFNSDKQYLNFKFFLSGTQIEIYFSNKPKYEKIDFSKEKDFSIPNNSLVKEYIAETLETYLHNDYKKFDTIQEVESAKQILENYG